MPNLSCATDVEVAQSRFPLPLWIQCGLALSLFILAVLLPPLRLFSDPQPYLPLHITLEFLSIAAALMIFTIGWFSFGHERSARFQILACAFLAVALLDFVHTLSYAGMPDLVTPSSLEKAIIFWLPARLISALVLLTAAALSPKISLSRRTRGWLLAVTLIVIGVIIAMGLFFPDTAPRTFIPGQGLTLFKVAVEYAVMAIYALALIQLIRDWRRDRDRFRALLITGIWILLMGALSVTIYATVTDLHNLIGHLGKSWGEGLVFWAIYGQALEEPHRRLQQSERLLAHTEAQTQRLLRENRLLLDSAFVGIFFVQNRRFIRVNRCAETMFGYAPGELDDVSTEVIYPDYAAFQTLGERAYPLINRGEIFAGDMELVRKDSSRFWCLMRGQALNPEQPQDGSIWIMEDVTERRRARRALEDAASLYRAIFESRAVIKVLINPHNGHIVDANQAAAEFYGYPREVLRQHYAHELSATPREDLLTLFADFKTGRASLTQEYQTHHRRADGELRQVGIYLNLIQREDRQFLLATVLDITERKSTEAAIQANLALQRELLEAIPTPVFYKDEEGRYQSINHAFAELFGLSEADLIGKTVYDCWPREAADLFYARDQALFQNPGVQIYATQIKNPQGELRDVVFHKATLHHPDGRLRGLIGFILDVTERKAAEDALHESEERYRSAVAALADGVVVYNLEGVLVTANPAAERILGLHTDTFQERPVDDGKWRIIRKDGAPFLSDEWPSVVTLRTGVPQREVLMGVFRPDDRLSWILVSTEPIRDPASGALQAVVVSFSDITERKAAEDALRESEKRLQQVLDGANDGFWDWNIATGDVLFSPRWAEMLGYDLAEIEPHVRSWEQRVHPYDLPKCQTALQAHFAGKTVHYQCEHRIQAKNGEWRWILDRGKVTARDAQGQPLRMVGTHSDITERRRMEEALRVSLAEVKRHDAQMIVLNRMNDLLLSCETHEEAYAIIARKAGRLFAGCIGGLAITDEAAAPELRVVATWGDANALPTTFPLHDCWALRRGELHAITDLAQSAQCRHFSQPPTSAYLCIPLTVRGETFGLLHLSVSETPTEAQFQELRTLSMSMSESIKLALSNIKLREALREQAIRDVLTGLFNRRYLDETLPRELHRCQRRNEPLAAAMLDVDHFKRFNDAYGHEAGDAVLRAIGELLNRSLRSGDIACRYGGEELTVILPGSTLDDARMRLEHLRQAIMRLRVIDQGEDLPAITVSIGVAVAEEEEIDAAALLNRADAALYQAKADGRNRVVVARD